MSEPIDPREQFGEHGEWDALAVGWALSALDPEDEDRFADHLPGCARCTATVRESLYTVADLAYALPDEAPPPALKSRLMAAVAAEPRGAGLSVLAEPASPAEPEDPGEWPLGEPHPGTPGYGIDWFAKRSRPADEEADEPSGPGEWAIHRPPVGERRPSPQPAEWDVDQPTAEVRRPEGFDEPAGGEPGGGEPGGGEPGGGEPAGDEDLGEPAGRRGELTGPDPDLEAPTGTAGRLGQPGDRDLDQPVRGEPGGRDRDLDAPVGGEPASRDLGAPTGTGGRQGLAEPVGTATAGDMPPAVGYGYRGEDLPRPDRDAEPGQPPDADVVSLASRRRRLGRRIGVGVAAAAVLALIAGLLVSNVRLRNQQDDLRQIVAQRDAAIQQLTANSPARVAALTANGQPSSQRQATLVVRGDQIEIIVEALGATSGNETYWLWTLRCDTPQPTDLKPIRGFTVAQSEFSVRDIGSDPGVARAPCFAISSELGTATPKVPRQVVAVGQPE